MIKTTRVDVSDIYDIFFKVKISSQEEREKVVKHLSDAGFYYPNDGFDTVCGIAVGRAYIGEFTHETAFENLPNEERTVGEVLNMKFDSNSKKESSE